MSEVEPYLYEPRPVALAVLATLRAHLPPTEERAISEARVVLRGDLGDEPADTLRRALGHVERLHPAWRHSLAVTALDGQRVRSLS